MKRTHQYLLLATLAGGLACWFTRELRAAARRIPEAQPESKGRSSIDDIPTVQPEVQQLDDSVASGTPF
jgi:hypothetical protein